MTESVSTNKKKGGKLKHIITTVIVVLLVTGGIVAAYVSLGNQSTKEKYFSAEKESLDLLFNKFNDRYATEIEWKDYSRNNPTETAYEFSLQYDGGLAGDDFGLGFSPEQIINNSNLTFTTQKDLKEKKIATNIAANLSGLKIDDINFFLTDEKVMLGLPFLKETLQLKFDDIGNMLHEEDPSISPDIIKQSFNIFFNENNSFLTEEDIAYFKKEYVDMVYDALPEDAFKSSNEKVDVNGSSTSTEKITLHLDEDSLKDLLSKIFDKLQTEEKIKEIIQNQFISVFLTEAEIDEAVDEFQTGLAQVKTGIQELHIPDGLTSTLWIDNDLIVQRDFVLTIGPSADELITFKVDGKQLFNKNDQNFTYTFGFEDDFENSEVVVSGDLAWDGKQINDSITLAVEDIELIYTSDETVDKKDREFNREFTINDEYNETVTFLWSGNASYEKDQMSSEHILSLDDDYNDEDIALRLGIDSKRIIGIDFPTDNIKDLGEMSPEEITNFFEYEVAEQFEKWFMNLLGVPGGLFDF